MTTSTTEPTTSPTGPNANANPSSSHVLWLRMFRIPLLLVFAVVAYEAVRLPLTAEPMTASNDQLPAQEATATDATDQEPTDAKRTAAAVELLALVDADSEDNIRPNGSAAADLTEEAPDKGAFADQTLLALNAGSMAVGGLATTLADGARQTGNDDALFDPEAQVEPTEAVVAESNPATVETSAVDVPAVDSELLVLINPSELELGYILNGEVRVLGPGQRHEIEANQTWDVKFHRGGEFGDADYQLSAGAYEFRVGDQGWELRE
jgi:hypothetical protein